jgi:hypothetical protein
MLTSRGPPLLSSGQRSWLQIRRARFDSRHYQKKSSRCSLENRYYGRRDPSRWPRGSIYPQKLKLTSPTSSGRLVCIFRSRTQTTKFVCLFWWMHRFLQYLVPVNQTTSRHIPPHCSVVLSAVMNFWDTCTSWKGTNLLQKTSTMELAVTFWSKQCPQDGGPRAHNKIQLYWLSL